MAVQNEPRRAPGRQSLFKQGSRKQGLPAEILVKRETIAPRVPGI